MVPLEDYATVSKDATLLEAVMALEKAQEDFDCSRYRHRAILVTGKDGKVVGKVSQLDVLKALEPKYQNLEKHQGVSRLGFSANFIELTVEQYALWDTPLEHICQKIAQTRVEEFMYTPSEGEYVTEDTSLDAAIHQLIVGKHQSLLVTSSDDTENITGILRLTDVFLGVFQIIRECDIS